MLGQFRIRQFVGLIAVLIVPLGLVSLAAPVPTPHLSRSLDLQRQYQSSLRAEQVLELATDQERFIALQLEQETASPEGGVLILHDAGQTPDWPYLLRQVREYLPAVGWTTLSIDLPTPLRDAIGVLPLNENASAPSPVSDEDRQNRVLARVASGIKQLNGDGIFNIAVIGYGDGAYWASRYLSERISEDEVEGYALILIDASLNYPELPDYLGLLTVPVLDLYMNDSDYSHQQARKRKAAAVRAEHPDYLQIHDALRHGFYGSPAIDRTTRRVWGWLRNHAAGYEANLTNKPTF
jgi:hypothetical protein